MRVIENMSNGILPLNNKTLTMLKQKHLEANKPPQEVLLQGPARPVHPVVYEDMDESLILKASILTKGRSGPSGLDADGWRKITSHHVHLEHHHPNCTRHLHCLLKVSA